MTRNKTEAILLRAGSCARRNVRHRSLTGRHTALTFASLAMVPVSLFLMIGSSNHFLAEMGFSYLVGFLFCLSAHEVIAWHTGQTSETCRYVLAVELTHILDCLRHPSKSESRAIASKTVISKVVVWLIFATIFAIACLTLQTQLRTPSTPASAVAAIIGAAAAGEIFLPWVARIQASRILARLRSIAREQRAQDSTAQSNRSAPVVQQQVVSEQAFPFTLPPGRA